MKNHLGSCDFLYTHLEKKEGRKLDLKNIIRKKLKFERPMECNHKLRLIFIIGFAALSGLNKSGLTD